MANFDEVVSYSENFNGYTGNPPTTETEYLALACWKDASIAPPWSEVALSMGVVGMQQSRKVEYPEIGDQLDALFHAGVFPPEMASQIQAVKDKFPKA